MPKTIDVVLEDELKSSYIDYAMSVIIGRAIPEARDGLKPAQRRILYAMYKLNNFHNQPTKKSARIVGEVIGKYHPHGDIAVYDTLVRMAQEFSMNHTLVEGQGNFGSIDGDPAAAQRYTEVRLTKIAEDALDGLEQNTVDMVPNFDNTEEEPWILPGKVPNLLVNGAQGIAVGVATSIPPHNLAEVCDAISYRLKKKEATPEEIMDIIKGPDFPTGGVAVMTPSSSNGYIHGRGQLRIKGKAEIDRERGRITITHIPYNVNKSQLIQNIAALTREKRLTGIRDIRDESDRKGISIVVELKQGENPEQVLNQIYRHTQMEVTFPIINLAIVGKSLKSLNILQLIDVYIEYREEVILRRSRFELGVAQDKLHITEGLIKAIQNIDSIIETIRESREAKEAKLHIMSKFELTEKQADAILEMRLSRLTRLEDESLRKDKEELESRIRYHNEIINNKSKIDEIIEEDMRDLKKRYGKPRKTEIVFSEGGAEMTDEDMISNDKVTVILTNEGYVKRMPAGNYKEQSRGGKGMISINLKEGDSVRQMINCNNKDYIVCISNTGRVYWLKAYLIPESSRYSEGRAIVNLLNLENEKIVGLLNIKQFSDSKIVFLTKKGMVKKMRSELFSHPRSSGIRALTLGEGDEIADAVIYSNEKYLIIVTKNGKAIRFDQESVRFTGRMSMGVRGIRMVNDEPVNILPANEEGSILAITVNGFGKITPIEEYRLQSRGGKGVRNMKINSKTGSVSRCMFLRGEKHLALINTKGKSITIPISSIRVTGRSASGVRLMRMSEGAIVSDAMLFDELNSDNEPEEPEHEGSIDNNSEGEGGQPSTFTSQ